MDIISPMPTTQDLIDMEYNEWQEAEAIKDGAEAIRDAIVEGTGAPEPEPDPAQQFVTENKSEIVAMLTEVPAHSREQLAELIQSMGDSHAVDITTAEANAILDTIENDPELAELSPVLGEPTADTTQVAHAAPEENRDYDIATPGMG